MPKKSPQKPHPSEEIWKILKEAAKERREAAKERKEAIKERKKERRETDRQLKEAAKVAKEASAAAKEASAAAKEASAAAKEAAQVSRETSKKADENLKAIKAARDIFTNQWGRLLESLVEGNLVNELYKRGIDIEMVYPSAKIYERRPDGHGNLVKDVVCEIDILARNGKEKVAVEVKTYMSVKDVKSYLGVLERHSVAISGEARKKVLGGMAFLRLQKGADIYAQRKGLFTVKVCGENAKITNRASFKPKVFGAAGAVALTAAKKRSAAAARASASRGARQPKGPKKR